MIPLLHFYCPKSKGLKYKPTPMGTSERDQLLAKGCPVNEELWYSRDSDSDVICVPIDDSNFEHHGLNSKSTVPSAPDSQSMPTPSLEFASTPPTSTFNSNSQDTNDTNGSRHLSANYKNPSDTAAGGAQQNIP